MTKAVDGGDVRLRTLTDKEALDRINSILSVDRWPGAEALEWIATICAKTGRREKRIEE